MRRLLKWLGGLVALILIAASGLFIATGGDQGVPATVTDDPSLSAVDVLGIRLHHQRVGPEDGPVVIVLHGGPGGDFRSLLPLAALAEDGYRVQFYDQRGAGLSERVDESALTLDGHIAELDALGKRVSPAAPVILIGHSWGGMLASAYLGRHPERVARAVLIEPGPLSADEFAAFSARMQGMMRSLGFLRDATLTGFRAAHIDGPDADASNDYLFGEMAHWFADHPDNPYHCPGAPWDSPSWRFGARAGQAVSAQASPAGLDSLGDVAGFPGPVLLLSGSCDSWLGAPLQAPRVAMFAEARHVEIEGAGHDVVDDQPDAALAAIRAFLAE